MTEDELLSGITEALTWGAWTWTHILRSDGVTMGWPGLPDILACHRSRPLMLAWELKSDRGQLSTEQFAWQLGLEGIPGIDYRVIRPADYDRALSVILRGVDPMTAFPREHDWRHLREHAG